MTEEEKVSYFLKDWYAERPEIIVHSWHPPCGKTYEGALVRIPKLVNGIRTRQRYHIDFILQVGSVLILQELKGAGAETYGDVEKLREIIRTYSPARLATVLKPRITRKDDLDRVNALLPSVAYAAGAATAPSPGFLRVLTDGVSCSADFGSGVGQDIRSEIARSFV